jgi:hypothetical protein
MNFKLINNNILHLSLVVLATTVFYLSPMLKNGFFSDDCLNSMVSGLLINNNTDVLTFTYQIVSSWISNGRIFPLAFYMYFIFLFVHNFFYYHLLILIAILVDILLFGYFIQIMTKSTYISLLSMLIMPLLFQFRAYHDPILSFCMLLQIVFFYLITSLITFTCYLKHNKKRYLIISTFLYILSMLTYEITYIFFPLFLITAYFYEDNNNLLRAIKKSFPYIAIALIFIFVVIAWRVFINVPISDESDSGAYTINTDPVAYVNALIQQSSAALPMSYYIFDPLMIFYHDPVELLSQINLYLLLMGILIFVCFALTFSKAQSDLLKWTNISRRVTFLGIFGFFLYLLPELLLSFSPKYQHELTMGVGYLPVFISYFGVSLVIVAFLMLISDKIARSGNKLFMFVMIVSLIFSLIVTLNYINNSVVVEKVNQDWLYPRALMEAGLHNGIFTQVPSGSFLLAQNLFPWNRPEFYRMYGGVNLSGIGLSSYDLQLNKIHVNKLYSENGTFVVNQLPDDNVYYINCISDSLRGGYVITGRVIKFNATDITLIDVTSQEIYIYIEGPHSENQNIGSPCFQINGQWSNMDVKSGFYPFNIKEGDSQLNLISSGPNWCLYLLRPQDCVIDIKSVSVEQMETIEK